MSKRVVLIKSYIKGYSRKNGTYVKPHQRIGDAAPPKPAPVHPHPKVDENGNAVAIKKPSIASAPSTWHNPNAVATFLPEGDSPMSLNGVPMTHWRDHPRTTEGWDYTDGINNELDEPAFDLPAGMKASSGVLIEEPDGRVWLIAPTNQFGGYKASVPKGTAEDELSLQGNALKEAFEETGLKVEITGLLGDFERTTSKARIYTAKRVGGSPTQPGWETQATHLVPKGMLYEYLNMWSDHSIAEAIGAGPAPKKEKPSYKGKNSSLF